jgi:uncharacterized integral membrane protein
MIKRIIAVVVLVPLAVIVIALSVANRHSVSLTLDPFHPGNPALSYSAPLFVWLFATLVLGLLIGAGAMWFGQAKHRKLSRQRGREADRLRRDVEEGRKREPSPDMSGTLPAPR